MPGAPLRYQYQHIAQAIKDQILKGEIGVGERLDSERILSERFQVHRNTIRQALAELENGGHISTQGRRGSYIQSPIVNTKVGPFVVNIEAGAGPNGAALYDGIAMVANQFGSSVVRIDTRPLPGSVLNRVPDQRLLAADTAGVILWPHAPTDTEQIRALNDALPVVLVDHRVSGLSIDCVRFDDVTGGRMVTHHLLTLGHRKIAFLSDEVFADSVQSRWHGYVLAHEDAGIPCREYLSLLFQGMNQAMLALAMRHLLDDSATRPTAIVCSNDLVAFSLMRFLNAEGLRVPDDMAVTGYGNSMPAYGAAISLTTVDQPFYKVGLEAGRLLTERVYQSASDRLDAPREICLPVSLVRRGSS